MKENWLSVEKGLPKDGDYTVKITNNGTETVATRRLIGGKWFGGCRPFADGDKVTHYKNDSV